MKRSVLLVDDEADIRRVAILSLQTIAGWTVREARSGREALTMLEDEEHRPDLVLLDVMMPEMDGPTTLANMRGNRRFDGIPVIFLTAKALPSDHAMLQRLGASGVLTKPFDPLLLAAQVDRIMESR